MCQCLCSHDAVSTGTSSKQSSLTGSVCSSRGHSSQLPLSQSQGCITVWEWRRRNSTKVCKMTQHPHTSSPALPRPSVQSRFWQPMKMGWMGMDLNAITLVVSYPETEQPGLASDGKKNHISTQAASREHPYAFLTCLSYLGFVCGGDSGLQVRRSCRGQ